MIAGMRNMQATRRFVETQIRCLCNKIAQMPEFHEYYLIVLCDKGN